METFSPELAHHWLPGQGPVTDEGAENSTDGALSVGEQAALEELAERVSAARSIY